MIYDELKTQSTSQTYDLTSPDFTTDDVKSLLAFSEPSNEDVVRTKPTQIIYNITTDSSDINAEASGVLSKTTDTMVNSDVAPDTLFALTMSSDTTDFEMEKLSR